MIAKKKISELPVSTSFEGMKTIGVNAQNQSVAVPLDFIPQALNAQIAKALNNIRQEEDSPIPLAYIQNLD